MAANTQQIPGSRDPENRAWERCYVCAKELSDEEALIVADYDPVDFLEGRGVLKGYETRCEDCIALLPECPVCEGLMNECPTCGAHYCRGHAMASQRQRRRADHAACGVTVRFLLSDTGRDGMNTPTVCLRGGLCL